MIFKNVEIGDMPLINEYFKKQNSRMSDFTSGVFFAWAEYLETQFCILDGELFVRFYDRRRGHIVYAYPITGGDIRDAIKKIDNKISDRHAFILSAVPLDALAVLDKHYNINYHYKRDWSDYLYDGAEFREFKGKKFHDKRNHISRFLRDYGEYVYEEITDDNINEALGMFGDYKKNGDLSALFKYELRKSREVLKKMPLLGLTGGMIKIDGKVVGVTAGEMLGDTLFVHIEKALRDYNGAYTVLANEFAKRFPEAKYINREDDAGDEGLRKSKLSYNPIGLIDKYVVCIRGFKSANILSYGHNTFNLVNETQIHVTPELPLDSSAE